MQSTPDEVLIGRIANGDRLAMQVLYARYHVRVFRFVVRLVRDEATAEDMISEVFLDLWRQAGRFEGRSTVSTWLLAIAAPTPLPKSRLISPIFTGIQFCSTFRRKKTGNRTWSTPGSDAAKADLLGEVPALRCPAVTCNVS